MFLVRLIVLLLWFDFVQYLVPCSMFGLVDIEGEISIGHMVRVIRHKGNDGIGLLVEYNIFIAMMSRSINYCEETFHSLFP